MVLAYMELISFILISNNFILPKFLTEIQEDENKLQVFLRKKIKPLTNFSRKLELFKNTEAKEESKVTEIVVTGNF